MNVSDKYEKKKKNHYKKQKKINLRKGLYAKEKNLRKTNQKKRKLCPCFIII